MHNALAIFMVSLLVSGCATTSVSLRHPETEHAVECRGDAWTPAEHTEACAQGYEQAGYVRILTF